MTKKKKVHVTIINVAENQAPEKQQLPCEMKTTQ